MCSDERHGTDFTFSHAQRFFGKLKRSRPRSPRVINIPQSTEYRHELTVVTKLMTQFTSAFKRVDHSRPRPPS